LGISIFKERWIIDVLKTKNQINNPSLHFQIMKHLSQINKEPSPVIGTHFLAIELFLTDSNKKVDFYFK